MGNEYYSLPSLAMVMVQVGYAGLNVVSKLAMDAGMSPFVMVTYRQFVAALFLSPIAFFSERKTRTAITRKVLFQIFLCSIFGATMNPLFYFMGLKYTTPTIACALSNTLPAITFVFAAIFRMEKVGMKSTAGQAKVWGTALCVGGSMLMTFFQGPLVHMFPSGIHWKYAEAMSSHQTSTNQTAMILGSLLVIASCLGWAVWFIIQAKMSESFSSPYTSTAIMSAMSGVQCLVVAAAIERQWSVWALGWDVRLIAAIYTGVVGSGLAFVIMSWCVEKRGALYVSMFSPLLLVVVAVVGWAMLDEKFDVGSIIGSMLIVGGLYSVLWGKGREMNKSGGGISKNIADVSDDYDDNIDVEKQCLPSCDDDKSKSSTEHAGGATMH